MRVPKNEVRYMEPMYFFAPNGLRPDWISGFVDGEGCFQIAITLKEKSRYGITLTPSFSVAQHFRSGYILDALETFFQCGSCKNDTHSRCRVYEVRKLHDLRHTIVPFFHAHPLRTSKKEDFARFHTALQLLANGEHLNHRGLLQIVTLAYSMNSRGKHRRHL